MPVKFKPDRYATVTPYLMVKDAQKFIDFMSEVFGARVIEQLRRPDRAIGHTELQIAESVIMLSEAMDDGPTPVMLHFYVPDVDAAFERAVRAGGTIVSKPADQFYGD